MRGAMLSVAGVLAVAGMITGAGMAQAAEGLDEAAPKTEAAAPVQPEVKATESVPAAPAPAETQAPVAPAAPAAEAGKVAVPPAAVAPEEAAEVMDADAAWRASDWQIGTRFAQIEFQDKTRGTRGNNSFFGTITEITEEQDSAPDKAYLQYRLFHLPVWIGVSYDHASAKTQDDIDTDKDGVFDAKGSDGSQEIQGFIPYLQAMWENGTRVTPFVQAGYAFFQADFKPNSWGQDGRRTVEASSSVNGVELAGGLNIRLYKNLSADLFVKSMQVDDITGAWYTEYGRIRGGDYVMTMSYTAYGAGVNYRF